HDEPARLRHGTAGDGDVRREPRVPARAGSVAEGREAGGVVRLAVAAAERLGVGPAVPRSGGRHRRRARRQRTRRSLRPRGAVARAASRHVQDVLQRHLLRQRIRVMTQQMVDQVFSFAELGFQEFDTSNYLTGILEKNGFKLERGYAGIPTAWTATWGSGKPVNAIGSDIDDIPQASQKPGVA